MDRRTFLRTATLFTSSVMGLPALAACSGGAESRTATDSEKLRVSVDAGPTDTVDPTSVTGGHGSYVALYSIFDSLLTIEDGRTVNGLATDLKASPDGTRWTIELDKAARFSDGTQVTAGDVIASCRHLSTGPLLGAFWTDIDFDASAAATTASSTTAVFMLRTPRTDFADATLALSSTIAKGGDFTAAVGSGPYRLLSQKPGEGWVLTANPHHAGTAPHIPDVEISVVRAPDARIALVRDGQADLATGLSSANVVDLDPQRIAVNAGGPGSQILFGAYLNTTLEPFDDPEVRRAAKLVVDRQRLVDVIFRGQGTVGDDLVGLGLPGYAGPATPRTRDLTAARVIFARHRVTRISCATAEVVPGANDSIELLRQQFAEAGVELAIDQRDPAGYYADMPALKRYPMFFGYLVNRPVANGLTFSYGPNATFNLSGFDDAELNRQSERIRALGDPAEREKAYARIQQIAREEGGELWWGYEDSMTVSTPALRIDSSSQGAPLLRRVRRS